MRTVLAVIAVICVAACDRAAPDPRGVKANETLPTVSASGRADSRPDEARLQLGVQALALSAGEASRLNREKMDKVTSALTRLGVRPDDLQTRNLSLQRIDYGAERGRFRAENTVEVRLRDMARVGDAVTAVTEAGANILSGPDLRVSDREKANKSAYAAAYRAARTRADTYAEAAGLEVSRVLAIYDGGEHSAPPSMRNMSMDAVAQSAGPRPVSAAPFNPGVNSTEVQVRVDFALSK